MATEYRQLTQAPPHRPAQPAYLLPEEAHQQLQSLCHHLHLLAQPSQPEYPNPDDLVLPRAGLAQCFTQLAEAADQIVGSARFQPM